MLVFTTVLYTYTTSINTTSIFSETSCCVHSFLLTHLNAFIFSKELCISPTQELTRPDHWLTRSDKTRHIQSPMSVDNY